MAKMPDHFSLLKEHPASFEIHDKRDNSSFHIAKQHLDAGGFAKMKNIKKYSDGGKVDSEEKPQPSPTPFSDPQKTAQAEESLRNAFHFSDGTPPGGVPEMHLSAQDVNPNTIVNPNWNQPTPTQVAIDQASEELKATPEKAADALAELTGQVPSATPDSSQDSSTGVAQANYTPLPQNNQNSSDDSNTSNPVQTASLRVSPNVSKSNEDDSAPQQIAIAPSGPKLGSVEDYQSQIQKNLDDLNSPNGSYSNLSKAIQNNKINPEDYWKDHSKVAASIGIILGGLGQGLSHSSTNQALAVVQDGIKREVDAQEKNNANDMDLLKLNNGNKLATMNQLYTMAQMTIQKQAQQTNTQQANLQGKLLVQQIQALKQQNAIKQGSLQFLNNPNSAAGDTSQSPINNSRWQALKGAGIMSQEDDTNATKEATNYVNLSQQAKSANAAFDQLGKEKGAMAIPEAFGYKPVSEIAFDNAVGPFVKDEAGRPSPELMHQAQQFKPQPYDPPSRVAEKRVAFNQWTQGRAATPTLDRLGLINKGYQQLAQSGSGDQIQYKGGIPYKRVGNYMVPLNQKPMVAGR